MIFPEFDPVALQLGPLSVRWYGLMYLAGFACAWWLGRMRARRPGAAISAAQMDDLLFYAALGVILGGPALGLAGAWLAVGRHLAQIQPE